MLSLLCTLGEAGHCLCSLLACRRKIFLKLLSSLAAFGKCHLLGLELCLDALQRCLHLRTAH
jgi:hypothetical protein